MIDQYVLASNDDGELAIRTVQATESSSVTDTTSVITATDDGKLAVRVVGGGGGDQHNLGWYATESALTTAHPTATDGDWAIVGATDTVWVWDSDSTAWKDTGQAGIELPDQTGHSGEFLTTDGSSASWSNKPLVNKATGTNSFVIGNTNNSGSTRATSVGDYATAYDNATSVGSGAWATQRSLAIGVFSGGLSYVSDYISIGYYAQCYANYAIQLGRGTNTTAGTMSVGLSTDGNTWNNYELLSSDGTIPTARLTNAINKYSSMPTAGADYLGQIAQFTGTTDATYTHGYIYECVSDGADPATYSWTEVQLGGGGGLQNTATTPGSLTILGTATSNSESINIGQQSEVHDDYSVVFGNYARTRHSEKSVVIGFNSAAIDIQNTPQYNNIVCGYATQIRNASNAIAVGNQAFVNANGAMQFGKGANSEAGTVCFALTTTNDDTLPPNYKLLDSDGTIPADRLASTTGLADGNYRLRLTMTNGVPTLSWVAE